VANIPAGSTWNGVANRTNTSESEV
jgi:hypothetical protein